VAPAAEPNACATINTVRLTVRMFELVSETENDTLKLTPLVLVTIEDIMGSKNSIFASIFASLSQNHAAKFA
jgi:hypothetical protein